MKKLAILSPSNNTISETFITAHRQLPFPITFIYGGTVPYIDEKKKLNKLTKLKIGLLKGFKIFFKKINPEGVVLYRILNRNEIDVVLAEYGVTAADSLNAIKKAKCKLIVHFHGFDASIKEIIDTYHEKYQEMFRYADKVIVVSLKMKEIIISLGCPLEKIILNYYGPSPDFQKITPNLNSKNFVGVGRFVDKKAPYLTLLAFHKILFNHPEAKLTMIGDGPLLPACKVLTEVLEMRSSVRFLGAMGRETVIEEFSKAVAFVQHSITAENGDSEGTPVAILEAQLAGLPVISTHHAGIPDVVLNGKTGIIVKEKDIEGMSMAMLKVLEDTSFTEKLSANAKKHVLANYSLERHLTTISELI